LVEVKKKLEEELKTKQREFETSLNSKKKYQATLQTEIQKNSAFSKAV